MTQKNKILVYQDYVHNNGILHARLCETYGQERVFFCDAEDILSGALSNEVFLFVIPGGADLYYCEKLNGAGNKKIRKYVEQGGNYLGICAGAYYACDEIDWDQGAITGPRELKFFEGQAVGPLYEYFEDGDIEKSWQNIVRVKIAGQDYASLYYAGPKFENDNSPFGIFGNGNTAIVKRKIGNGTAILSSTHIEYRPQDFAKICYQNQNKSIEWQQGVLKKFNSQYEPRHDIWSRIMSEFEQ